MKKYIVSAIILIVLTFSSMTAVSRPIYIGFRLGIRAVWEITFSNCKDGRGLCLSIGNPNNPDNAELGYDETESAAFYLKISKSSDLGKSFATAKFELQQDSPIDPALISKFNTFKNPDKRIVILKKGIYPVKIEGDYCVIAISYFLR
jgi:hypothetical protein